MKNIETNSGFLVLIPSSFIGDWHGSDNPGRDYEFFCENSKGYVSHAIYKGHNIIMFGGEPTSFLWYEDSNSYYIIRVIYAEIGFESVVGAISSGLKWSLDAGFQAMNEKLVFLDPVLSGNEAILEKEVTTMGACSEIIIYSSIYQDSKYHLIFHKIDVTRSVQIE